MKRLGITIFLLLCASLVLGQGGRNRLDIHQLDSAERALLSRMYDMTLDELIELKTSDVVPTALNRMLNDLIVVAGKKGSNLRQAPGAVTLFTEEDIQNMGARDLIDVLRMVPGFHFALDEYGNVGLGVRGNWANEGKVLLLIDGQEMNDIYTATLAFGNHFPVDLIERIEVMRGPGSSVYGGFAEYGVINIKTKEFSGLQLGMTNGEWRDNDARARRTYTAYAGAKGRRNAISISYFGGQGQRSDKDQFGFYRYTDPTVVDNRLGQVGSLLDNSKISPQFFNFHLRLGGFHIRSITDFYQVQDVTTIDTAGQRPLIFGAGRNYTEARYDIKMLGNRLTLTPKINTIVQGAGNLTDNNVLPPRQNNATARARAGIHLNWDISHRVNLLAGAETWGDLVDLDVSMGLDSASNFTDTFSTVNSALYAQTTVRIPGFANITTGLRYDYNNQFGEAYSPRIALTQAFRRFHYKLLGSAAFRAPTVGNLALAFDGTYEIDGTEISVLGRELDAERSVVLEAELGYKLSKNAILTGNVFAVRTDKPIVYHYYQDNNIRARLGERAGIFVYQNFPSSGSWGVELDYRFKESWGSFNANYSFYSTQGFPQPTPYQVRTFDFNPERRELFRSGTVLAFPQHKLNLMGSLHLSRKLVLTGTATYFSRRYAYQFIERNNDWTGVLSAYPSHWLVNGFLRLRDFPFSGVSLGVGINDILDRGHTYLQPYFGLNQPLPGPSRELVFKASWDFGANKRQREREAQESQRAEPIPWPSNPETDEKNSREKFSTPRNVKSR